MFFSHSIHQLLQVVVIDLPVRKDIGCHNHVTGSRREKLPGILRRDASSDLQPAGIGGQRQQRLLFRLLVVGAVRPVQHDHMTAFQAVLGVELREKIRITL